MALNDGNPNGPRDDEANNRDTMLTDKARGARLVLNHDHVKPFAWFGPPFVFGANDLHWRARGVASAQLSTRNAARPNTTHSTAAVIIAMTTTNQNSQFANLQSKGKFCIVTTRQRP